jgi:hypothetical protein
MHVASTTSLRHVAVEYLLEVTHVILVMLCTKLHSKYPAIHHHVASSLIPVDALLQVFS